ncbi:hypothetical protein GGP41_005995 [Bipolaris sorokiniana]|uniref:Uncharacterized protein n=1 Tax=Cochliobolus sativus TaxID=45130 RepID=A0A8H5ZH12_COCSA|nr:hypothetical protein GGP41_005995 [Bipolaris sorokiniana]
MLGVSSCLYNISILYSMYNASDCANYKAEATLQLSAGLAPNLKHRNYTTENYTTLMAGFSSSVRERMALSPLRSLSLLFIFARLCALLHPLVELEIIGPGTIGFKVILKRHGDDLQVLCIEDFILSAH